jgi:hypothetical protein
LKDGRTSTVVIEAHDTSFGNPDLQRSGRDRSVKADTVADAIKVRCRRRPAISRGCITRNIGNLHKASESLVQAAAVTGVQIIISCR